MKETDQISSHSPGETYSSFNWMEQLSGEKWPILLMVQMWRIKIPEQLEEWTVTELVKIEKRHLREYQSSVLDISV